MTGRNHQRVGAGQFAVWAPEPDPKYPWRGTSWITSVMREMLIDGQVTDHEGKFFEKAATPGLVFLMDPSRTPEEIGAYASHVLFVPRVPELFAPVVVTPPLQMLAYHIAKLRGCDVDQPRNLAKSVTVE